MKLSNQSSTVLVSAQADALGMSAGATRNIQSIDSKPEISTGHQQTYIEVRLFKSLPFTARKIEATEARLQAIYDAAALGLKGDSLALAAGMLPQEYRQLCQFDPLAEMAEMKGRADSEMETSGLLRDAARAGDAKAALAILQHTHGWTAKQEISIDVYQKISITQALQQAQERVIDGLITEQKPDRLEYASTQERTRASSSFG